MPPFFFLICLTYNSMSLTESQIPPVGTVVQHKGKDYVVSENEPNNYDLVITGWGVWTFLDTTGKATAPLPYWANKNACKKLILK